MPRDSRIQVNRVPPHIVQRGHNREACFFGEEDYANYLHWLDEALAETECRLNVYALMTNHVHVLLIPKRQLRCHARHVVRTALCAVPQSHLPPHWRPLGETESIFIAYVWHVLGL